MKAVTFVILHNIVLAAIWLAVLITDAQNTASSASLAQLIGAGLVMAVYIAAAELFFFGVSATTPALIGRSVRALWGLSVLPLLIFTIADYKVFQALGSHLDTAAIGYSIANLRGIAVIVVSEISLAALATVIAATAVCLALAQFGWKARHKSSRVFSAAAAIPPAVFFLTIVMSENCPSARKNPEHATQSYAVSLLDYINEGISLNECSAPDIRDTRSSIVSSLKLAQLKRGLFGNNDFFKDKDEISAVPLKLTKTGQSKLDNVVIIALESFRADAVTPYNSELDTTPFLDRLSREGIMADTAYVDFFHTSKSLTAINCGMPPHPRYTVIENRPGGMPYDCLPQLLKPLGYTSAFFQTATKNFENRDKLTANMGFDDFFSLENIDHAGWEKVNYFGIEDRAMIDPIMNWVGNQESPFLLSLVTLTSHHYYNTPSSFASKQYEGSEAWNKYLNTVRYTDSFLQELFQEFKNRGLLDNTLFILTADHGVGVGLHDTNYPYQGNIKVPLIIWSKNLIDKPRMVTGPRQHTDIIPTLVDLMKLEVAEGSFYGQSLLENAKGRTLYIACKLNNCQVLVNNEFKFVTRSPDNKSPALFDLAQKTNLAQLIPREVLDGFQEKSAKWREHVIDIYE